MQNTTNVLMTLIFLTVLVAGMIAIPLLVTVANADSSRTKGKTTAPGQNDLGNYGQCLSTVSKSNSQEVAEAFCSQYKH